MLSERQILFRDYLIKKIGFIEDTFFSVYLEKLSFAAPNFRYLESIPIPSSPELYKTVEDFGISAYAVEGIENRTYKMKNGLFVPSRYNIIDFLNYEYKVKKNSQIKIKDAFTNYISATDLANYTYCPVSFSISKTFDLKKIESAYNGTDLHESHRLINFISSERGRNQGVGTGSSGLIGTLIKPENELFFNEIERSTVIYQGHGKAEQKKYFKSFKGDYVGQPDYILQNSSKDFFVVEEKFQYQSTQVEKERYFHNNHINQLISYLYGINDYNIKYGYLVYWKFDFDYGDRYIHSCQVVRIEKNEIARNQIIAVYSKLKNFINNKVEGFDITNRNPSKCANCVSNLLCGHKTGRFSTLKYPYSTEYLKTHYAEFPKELKKDYIPDEQNELGSKSINELDAL
ncbi:hypothetical protein SAMN05660909_05681 [Chitinophaga terrae (ex Kim and Jung 2007)]|uniref:PD-(D/E)XK endonuclease-like domain-containing protein n=1 Tax=Chitinophaga terrae (ex Kim and Jung 2007) TaxID=408074 RepID=A0A1H4GSN0_9BACT|nr:hypothetical protein [Chitinophaga terrae (ex Kim and Jung 2007)]GEP93722.1 hypothetical protein CTE07_53670 [Chitinophaga terrae (ex Kim and Jung 2007)]SEB12563.1 hypothetical protein SAMN05660909_05681 [Chitinophaga terrae (ex Kim and Jung 2007)]